MPVDADEALRRATLVRSDPSLPGVTRENIAAGEEEVVWQYTAPDGEPIDEADRIDRWNALGLPPAWTAVSDMRTMANMTKGESATLRILEGLTE